MVEFLSLWLKKIILLILLATFIELLLPTSAMQRYVRMVIGLFVIMTIITPIFQFINKDWSPSEMYLQARMTSEGKGLEALSAIEQSGKGIQAQQQTQVQAVLKKQLEEQMAEQVQGKSGKYVKSVAVTLSELNQITDIQILLSDAKPSRSSPSVQPIKPIEPVQPIHIQVDEKRTSTARVFKSDDKQEARYQELAQWVAEKWGAAPNQVHIQEDSP